MQNDYLVGCCGSFSEEGRPPVHNHLHQRNAAASGAGGAGLLRNSIHSGHLTGRETLWHGTTADSAKKILREGILPTTERSARITNVLRSDPDKFRNSLGKVYTIGDKGGAASYAAQSALIERDGLNTFLAERHSPDGLLKFYKERKRVLSSGEGLVRLNAPTWKMRQVINPEVADDYLTWAKKSGRAANDPLEWLSYRQLRKARVFDGRVKTKHIVGAEDYAKNSLRELLEYIKARPARFAGGLGKAGLGVGLLGGAGYLAYRGGVANQELVSE